MLSSHLLQSKDLGADIDLTEDLSSFFSSCTFRVALCVGKGGSLFPLAFYFKPKEVQVY